MTSYWCESAWLADEPVDAVRVVVDDVAGRITEVTAGTPFRAGDHRLDGLVTPGFANTHSHAFHRALRGRTHDASGTFWTWRDAMYQVAATLDPDSYRRLATAAYAEMALAGITCVGEFHYLHHPAGGGRYDDPNAMAHALYDAADVAGVRLTLLDACYLRGGLSDTGESLPPDEIQRRFVDADVDDWADRVSRLRPTATARVGAAAHSLRAVPAEALPTVVAVAAGRPLHAHVSEQLGENIQVRAAYGATPVEVLAAAGALGPATIAVHATHLTDGDIATLAASGAGVCLCPTTERDLADGVGPAGALAGSGVALSLGSDQHAIVDLFEESRAVELHERLVTHRRGHFTGRSLLAMMTETGHAALGWPEAGRIEVGAVADLVAVRTDSVRTAGARPDQIVLAAAASDVHAVVNAGRLVVSDGHHVLGDIGQLLTDAIGP
ncbi:MAG TPA: formimidoylglutamate deiminase [Mycobacteriales bacterium]|nr:formimidoylglutamate deiminase [Mycobacteriales bacterium]